MADTQDADPEYLSAYRERHVDNTLEDHERRITKNERRWLVTKGALAMLAAIKGVDFAVAQVASFI